MKRCRNGPGSLASAREPIRWKRPSNPVSSLRTNDWLCVTAAEALEAEVFDAR
jgi:hypothetical protein